MTLVKTLVFNSISMSESSSVSQSRRAGGLQPSEGSGNGTETASDAGEAEREAKVEEDWCSVSKEAEWWEGS